MYSRGGVISSSQPILLCGKVRRDSYIIGISVGVLCGIVLFSVYINIPYNDQENCRI